MQNRAATPSWEKTKVQCLVRHAASKVYYARTRVRGKLLWKSLKTDVFSVAKARLTKVLIELGGGCRTLPNAKSDIETVGQAAARHLENVERPMARLLDDLRTNPRIVRDPKRRDGGYVLAITECQKAINKACHKLGIPRLTHHGLRHLNATVAIESGVDIPTMSRFLGHKDGGALAMKTYGHLRRDHFLAAAAKIAF